VVEDEVPETQYAWVGQDRVAYQVFGRGEIDVLFTATSGDAMDVRLYWPPYADFLRCLGSQARVIMFDRRGSGSSDRATGEPLPGWEQWADDARAVLDAVESERAVLFGMSDGGPVAILFAASHPHRTRGLILVNTTASYNPDAGSNTVVDDPLGLRDRTAVKEFVAQAWGTRTLAEIAFPDAIRDPAFLRWALASNRLAYSPRDASGVYAELTSLDVRNLLGSVRAPTLVVHREDCPGSFWITAGIWPSTSLARALPFCQDETFSSGRNRPSRGSGTSRSSSPGCTVRANRTVRSPRSCSPISSAQPNTCRRCVITPGAISWTATT